MNNRRKFLKQVCPTVAFAFFGLSFLEACSTDEASDPINNNDNNENNDGVGYISEGNIYTIDLNSSNFASLASVGGWMNGYSIGLQMLFLRISEDTIQAYSNSCPHQGSRNLWELNGDNFRCNDHGYSFSNDCSASSGSLDCYTSIIEGNSLIVTI